MQHPCRPGTTTVAAVTAMLLAIALTAGERAIAEVRQADKVVITICPEERPQSCPEPDPGPPVCGHLRLERACPWSSCGDEARWRPYPSACAACSDDDVEGWKPGDCPE